MASAGRVVFVTRSGGIVVVRHGDGYCLVEMLGNEGELGVGDAVSGNWDEVGGETVRRGSEKFDCYFQGTWGDLEGAVATAQEAAGER